MGDHRTAEIRDLDAYVGYVSSWRPSTSGEFMRIDEQQPELSPDIDERERFLVGLFLRRYVTYCARA